jgi:hypothetical protein
LHISNFLSILSIFIQQGTQRELKHVKSDGADNGT